MARSLGKSIITYLVIVIHVIPESMNLDIVLVVVLQISDDSMNGFLRATLAFSSGILGKNPTH